MLYIFDLDGTLVDSLEDLAEASNKMLEELNLPTHDLNKYRYFVGNGVRKLVLRALGKENEHLYDKARQLFDLYYEKHCLDHTKPYPEISDLLHHLHETGHFVGVVTNKPDILAKKICHHLFGKNVDYVLGQIEKMPIKPNPSSVIKVMNHYHATKKQTVMIGDSDVDIITGRNAGIKSIGVTWGNRDKEELIQAGASYIVSNVQELKMLLEKTKK